MEVSKYINFNGKLVWTTGVVTGTKDDDCFVVDFKHEGTLFRGWWHVNECEEKLC